MRTLTSVILLVCSVNTAMCQVEIRAFINDTVLLPCSYREVASLSKTASVYWMDSGDRILLQVTANTSKGQDQRFNDRVESFPLLYAAGNFSIRLKKVQESDSSSYSCRVPSTYFRQSLFLNVSGRRDEPVTPGVSVRLGVPGGADLNFLHVFLLPLSLCGFFSSSVL